jgi:hypothetical protein
LAAEEELEVAVFQGAQGYRQTKAALDSSRSCF